MTFDRRPRPGAWFQVTRPPVVSPAHEMSIPNRFFKTCHHTSCEREPTWRPCAPLQSKTFVRKRQSLGQGACRCTFPTETSLFQKCIHSSISFIHIHSNNARKRRQPPAAYVHSAHPHGHFGLISLPGTARGACHASTSTSISTNRSAPTAIDTMRPAA